MKDKRLRRLRSFGHPRRTRSAGRGSIGSARGNRSVKRAPSCTSSQVRSPRCWQAMRRAIASPRPLPLEAPGVSRMKRSKIRSRSSPATPGPSSSTLSLASSAAPATRSRTWPPDPAAATALLSRLRMTRERASGSPATPNRRIYFERDGQHMPPRSISAAAASALCARSNLVEGAGRAASSRARHGQRAWLPSF